MPKRFFIIDGHAQIYRCYYSPFRELFTPSGEPTKAPFVFTQMLINIAQQKKPDYLAMVIDHGDETTFRKKLDPTYKATRKPPPDDFHPQEQRIMQIVRDAGVPIFEKPGFEADDLIATMAVQLRDQDFDVFLVSKDKDLRQILSDRIRLYDPSSDEEMNAMAMRQKLGYGPEQSIEVQTLMGDKIDNIPGIPGVGEKTALELINQFGTAAAVKERASEIKKPKLRENVLAHTPDKIALARTLVTLDTKVEMPTFSVEACKFDGFNVPALRPVMNELGFSSLLKRIDAEANAPIAVAKPVVKKSKIEEGGGLFDGMGAVDGEEEIVAESGSDLATTQDCDYRLVNTPELFAEFLAALGQQTRFAFDTETDDLGAMKSNIVGMSFSWEHGTGWYVAIRGPTGGGGEAVLDPATTLEALRPIMESSAVHKVGHNLKYDILAMRSAGICVRGVVGDSLIGAFVLDASRLQYGIDTLTAQLLRIRKIATEELIGKGKSQTTMDKVPLAKIARYASEDADISLRLVDRFDEELAAAPTLKKLYDEIEIPLIDAMVEMEFNGVAVDGAILKEQSGVLAERIERLHVDVMAAAGQEFNPDSPKQLAEVLFEKLKLKTVKKTKTGYSTDVQVLERLAGEHPVPKLILQYRSLVKLKNTYLDNLPTYINTRTGRIHPSFNQTGAATGRLSCSDPNLQNIPIRTDEGRRIRLAFTAAAKDRVLITADYSQIELRILAHFTKEPALVKAFAEKEDIHRAVAAEVFGVPLDQVDKEQRSRAKTINFGIIYGITAMGLSRRIEGLSMRQADEFIKTYNARFPAIARFMEQCVMEAQAQGYVETLMGRRRPLPDVGSAVMNIRNAAERMAINSVIQGTAADMIKLAMLRIHRRSMNEKCPAKMLLQVHDELVFDCPVECVEEQSTIIREEMIGALPLDVPIEVEVGHGVNWGEGK